MPKIKIVYSPKNGDPVRDGDVLAWADEKVEWYKTRKDTKNTLISNTASELCIDALRVKVKEGEINHKDLFFIYKEEGEEDFWEIVVNEHGNLSHYPEGFCDTSIKLLDKLLDL